jgi:aldehyde:ferredoxin oxidoreductase
MPHGYNGRILRLDLSSGDKEVEEPGEIFYRRYLGGWSLIAHHLLKALKPGIDPLSEENKLIFACGPITGAPIAGSGRNAVGGKSPLTSLFGEADVGGYWGAELKRAGYDALIVEGRAKKPVYIWIHDDQVEIRDASHLWGQLTAPVQEAIREELEDPLIRVTQIGPAGENLVRFACVVNDLHHFAGRTGMGAVMGSKNLKAIAVRGRRKPSVADPEGLRSLARWLAKNYMDRAGGLHKDGTAGDVEYLNKKGGLPTRNFQAGSFEAAEAIAGPTMTDTILVGRKGCFSCAIRCKRRVAAEEPYKVDPTYGGPEYETVAALGSNCGVSDLVTIAKGNELCNAYGLDTISTGSAIAFAMECYEKGLLTRKDTDGLELTFGNAPAMIEMVERIARREGLGDTLAQGVKRAAERIGSGAEEYALHVKGQEIPMHEPRWKQGLGVGYALSPTGADHCHNLHDNLYTRETRSFRRAQALAILEPLPVDDLSPAKVRLYHYVGTWRLLLNSLGLCLFLPYDYHQVRNLVNAVTGWNTSLWELLKVGERGHALARAFNAREGLTPEDDRLPHRFFSPLGADTPALKGVAIEEERLKKALVTYYGMAGWDPTTGIPTRERLEELDIGWVAEELAKRGRLP